MNRMLSLGACIAVSLAACVTEQSGNARVQSPTDLIEAARINTQLGSEYARQGRFDIAEEKLRRAVEQDETYALAHTTLAYVLTQRGDNAEAEKQYRRALALDPGDASTHNQFGVLLCLEGKTADGDKEFMLALRDKNYSTPEAAWTNAGVCARRAGDAARAEENSRQALKIKPEHAEALALIASLAYEKQDWLRARAFVQRFEHVEKMTPEMLFIAAGAERRLGDSGAAKRYEAKLLREFPESDQAVQLSKKANAP